MFRRTSIEGLKIIKGPNEIAAFTLIGIGNRKIFASKKKVLLIEESTFKWHLESPVYNEG